MGFRKTPKGNIIYDFDFTPKKLVPLKYEDCHYDSCYAVEGDNGQRAPVIYEFQGERHPNGCANIGFCTTDAVPRGECVMTFNAQLACVFCMLMNKSANEEEFDPWGTDSLADKGFSLEIPDAKQAEEYLRAHGYPRDNYASIRLMSE